MCNDYSVISLTETWLIDNIRDNELFDNRYVVFRQDRSYETTCKSRGGGVLIAVNKSIPSCQHLRFLDVGHREEIWVELKLVNNVSLILGIVYFPPKSPIELYASHIDCLNTLAQHYPNSIILIAGDFNLPNIKWICDN